MKIYRVAFGDADGEDVAFCDTVKAESLSDAYEIAEEEYGERPSIVYDSKEQNSEF